MRRSKDEAPRIFLGPLEISGYYANLERGFSAIDVTARLVTLHPHPLAFEQPQRNPWPARFSCAVVIRHRSAPTPVKVFTGILYLLACVATLLWTIPRFNTYIFSWGMSLLPRNLDLPLLRALGKRVIVVVGHGSEARPPYMSTPENWTSQVDERALSALNSRTSAIARKLARIERWAHHVVGLPTTAQLLTETFVDFLALGIPTEELADVPESTGEPRGSELVVLHVPSKPEVKGTDEIRRCMASIVASRPHVRYRELTGRPHSEILEAIAGCDLVIDQLWSDIPMAVVGTEAAALGKPSVISGYAWSVWEHLARSDGWPPTILTEPDGLEATIAEWLTDPERLARLGTEARTYVSTVWKPRTVAQNYLRIIAGTAPADWNVDPADIRYGLGCGVSEENVRIMVDAMVSRFGIASLRWPAAAEVYGYAAH